MSLFTFILVYFIVWLGVFMFNAWQYRKESKYCWKVADNIREFYEEAVENVSEETRWVLELDGQVQTFKAKTAIIGIMGSEDYPIRISNYLKGRVNSITGFTSIFPIPRFSKYPRFEPLLVSLIKSEKIREV